MMKNNRFGKENDMENLKIESMKRELKINCLEKLEIV